jgi:hypothetical protein
MSAIGRPFLACTTPMFNAERYTKVRFTQTETTATDQSDLVENPKGET